MPGESISTIHNRHAKSCGETPEIDFEECSYFSYFENYVGDQSLLVLDAESEKVTVYLGDAEWDNSVEIPLSDIIENQPSNLDTPDILPNEEEKMWLRAYKKALEDRF